jgi:hypothetical protein
LLCAYGDNFELYCAAFTVNRAQAGKAELVITITDREGLPVPFEVVRTDVGETVKYVPLSSGTLVVNLTFGGVAVPGDVQILDYLVASRSYR